MSDVEYSPAIVRRLLRDWPSFESVEVRSDLLWALGQLDATDKAVFLWYAQEGKTLRALGVLKRRLLGEPPSRWPHNVGFCAVRGLAKRLAETLGRGVRVCAQ